MKEYVSLRKFSLTHKISTATVRHYAKINIIKPKMKQVPTFALEDIAKIENYRRGNKKRQDLKA